MTQDPTTRRPIRFWYPRSRGVYVINCTCMLGFMAFWRGACKFGAGKASVCSILNTEAEKKEEYWSMHEAARSFLRSSAYPG